MKTAQRPVDEKWFMLDPVPVEHTVDFHARHSGYPFEEMDVSDFFRIYDAQRAAAVRTAIQRYYEKEPLTCFVVRKYNDEWICRRIV